MQANRKAYNMLMGLAVFFPIVGAIQLFITFEGYVFSSIDPMYILKLILPLLFWALVFFLIAKGAQELKSWARIAAMCLGSLFIVAGLSAAFLSKGYVFAVFGVLVGIYLISCSWKKWEILKISRRDLPSTWDAMIDNAKE